MTTYEFKIAEDGKEWDDIEPIKSRDCKSRREAIAHAQDLADATGECVRVNEWTAERGTVVEPN